MKKIILATTFLIIFLSLDNNSEAVNITSETLQFDFEYSEGTPGVIYTTFGVTTTVYGYFYNNTSEQIMIELGNTSPPLTSTIADFEAGGQSGAAFIIVNGIDTEDYDTYYSKYNYFYMVDLRNKIGPYVTLSPGEKFVFPWMSIDTSFIEPTGDPLDVILKSQNSIQWKQHGRIPDENGNLGDEVNYTVGRNLEIRFNPVILPLLTADLDGNSQNEVVIDFGPDYGIWIYYNDSTWDKLHDLSPQFMVVGDLDADPRDDLIIDFGDPYGIWIYYNNSTWTQLHNISPESMVTGDLDNNGKDDLIIDFGNPYGIWIYYNNTNWTQLHNISPECMVTGDLDGNGTIEWEKNLAFGDGYQSWLHGVGQTLDGGYIIVGVCPSTSNSCRLIKTDGNGQDDLVIDFGNPYGIWIYYNNSTWTQLHSITPEFMATGDLDNNGKADLIIDFGDPYGIWIYYNNSSWTQLHNISPDSMVIGNIDGDLEGKDDLVIDFGDPYGIWIYYNNSSWIQLHSITPEFMATGDLDGTDGDDIIIDFGDPYGIWIYYNNSSWNKLHNLSP